MLRWLLDLIRRVRCRTGKVLPKRERVQLILTLLRQAEPAADVEEALALIHRIVDEVEDQYSGWPKAERPPLRSERMYGPLTDMIRRNADGSARARTSGEIIHLGRDGSIRIETRSGQLRLNKPGKGTSTT